LNITFQACVNVLSCDEDITKQFVETSDEHRQFVGPKL